MGALPVLLLATFVPFVLGDVCDTFERGLTYEEVIECFQTVPYNEEVDQQILKEALYYVEHSALYDDYMNPPSGFEDMQMDQVEHVKNIMESEYTYDYEFHLDLVRAFADFHDAHQVYNPNIDFVYFKYLLPLTPQPYMGEDGYTHYKLTYPNLKYLDEYSKVVNSGAIDGGYTKEQLLTYVGKEIIKINDMDPSDYIVEVAKLDYISKDVGVAINHVLYESFYIGDIFRMGFPMNNEITYTLADEDTITIPYIYSDRFQIQEEEDAAPTEWEEEEDFSYMRKRVYQDNNVFFDLYSDMEKDEVIGVLYLGSMYLLKTEEMGENIKEVDYIYNLVGVLNTYKDIISRLIIDVRGNVGGFVKLGIYLTSWLNYDLSEPHFSYYRARTDVSYASIGQYNTIVYDPIDHYIQYPIEELQQGDNVETLEFTKPDGTKYTRDYTPLFTFEGSDLYIGNGIYYDRERYPYSNPYYEPIFDFDRVDVLIVTDGFCGSACSHFMWDVSELGAARTLSIGGIIKKDGTKYEPATNTFPSGPVKSISISSGGKIGFMYAKIYSKIDPSSTLEFSCDKADFYLPYYPDIGYSNGKDYPELFYYLMATLDSHDLYPETEKILDIKRNPLLPCPDMGDNAIYGRKWNSITNEYDGICSFLYCGVGYYEDFTSDVLTCLPVPSLIDKINTGSELILEYLSEIVEEEFSELLVDLINAIEEQLSEDVEILEAFLNELLTENEAYKEMYDEERDGLIAASIFAVIFCLIAIGCIIYILVKKCRGSEIKKEHVPLVDNNETVVYAGIQ